jgi:PIN domain nuclease of toxin-antitoxin system
MSLVLDTSALLAFLHSEPGQERVRNALNTAHVSTVNWAEVLQKSLRRQVDITGMQEEFTEIGVTFEPFTPKQAEITAYLWDKTCQFGLSLADRSCLALAIDKETVVLTADRAWARLDLDIDIQLVR